MTLDMDSLIEFIVTVVKAIALDPRVQCLAQFYIFTTKAYVSIDKQKMCRVKLFAIQRHGNERIPRSRYQ